LYGRLVCTRSAASSARIASGVSIAHGSEPRPPAFDTAIASALPCTPAIGACTICHKPDASGKAAANAFSARLHRAHEGKTDCALCHTWAPGKSFGLLGQKVSWGKPSKEEMALLKQVSGSWATSTYMDAGHGKKNVTCMGCHGKALPAEGDSVENDRCLACHGPPEILQAKTAPKEFPDRNPHKSHLGDIGCTVCHKGHKESAVYCLQCHPNFQMKLK